MKRNQTIGLAAILVALLPVAFSACIKDKCTRAHTYSYYLPVYKTKDDVRANIKSNSPKELERTGKFYIFGNYIFLNEIDRGIHVIDNSNPSSPQNVAFIDIPGNMDIAVKGNILYADLYTDLVALDISNPSNVTVKKIVENLFPNRYWGSFTASGDQVIAEWKRIDTTVVEDCDGMFRWSGPDRADVFFSVANVGGSSGQSSVSPVGMGGSMARFAIMNERLYTVNDHELDVFNISNTADPVPTNTVDVGWDIETVYPFKNKLFIGSMNGMYIYNVTNPDVPMSAGQFHHVRTCDPVIADDDYAYVTLSGGSRCQGFTNELDIVKLNDFSNPTLVKVYPLTNPKGLSKSGNYLFICDGADGLKVYNASNVMNLQLIRTIGDMEAYDVVAYNNIALVVGKDGIYQYNYADINNIRLLSKITVNK